MADTVTTGHIRIDQIDFAASDMNVDLGDVRPLARSIKQYGVLEPIHVEIHGKRFKVVFGRHRVAGATLAKLTRIPALIHTEHLDEQGLLETRVQENLLRTTMGVEEKQRIIHALRKLKCTDEGIARTFATTPAQIKKWAKGVGETKPARDAADVAQAEPKKPRRLSAKVRATSRLVAAHPGEYEAYLAEERNGDRGDKAGPFESGLRLVS
jgi:ParB-like chromosome segregation protein Spo0J